MERTLNLKYSEKALLPAELTENNAPGDTYILLTGERVVIKLLGTWDNTKGYSEKSLEAESQALYGLTFSQVSTAWKRRIGELSGWWSKIKLQKQ